MAGKDELTEVIEKKGDSSFHLPNEKVMVEFVKAERGTIDNPKHVLYGGMMEGAFREFVPKKSEKTFKYIPLLSKIEQAFIEDALAFGKGDLNVYRPDNNYWDDVSLRVPKEGTQLNLSDPVEFMQFKMLLTYVNTVAPSLADLRAQNRPTYRFVVIRGHERENEEVMFFNVRREAYSISTKLETSTESMRNFLYLMGLRIPPNVARPWLVAKLANYVETSPEEVIKVHTAEDYSTRALLAKAVLAGVVTDTNNVYYLEGQVPLCSEGELPNLTNAIKFLASTGNADIKNLIDAKLGIK